MIDKITILGIKLERIKNEAKLVNIKIEFDSLTRALDEAIPTSEKLDQLTIELRKINEDLWDIEDDIRDCERAKDEERPSAAPAAPAPSDGAARRAPGAAAAQSPPRASPVLV